MEIKVKNSSKTAADIPQIILAFLARYQAKEIELDGNWLWFSVSGDRVRQCERELHYIRIPADIYYPGCRSADGFTFKIRLALPDEAAALGDAHD